MGPHIPFSCLIAFAKCNIFLDFMGRSVISEKDPPTEIMWRGGGWGAGRGFGEKFNLLLFLGPRVSVYHNWVTCH